MSEVDESLAQVNVLLSNVEVSLSKCPEVFKSASLLLPRIGIILNQMQGIVSHHLTDPSHTVNLSWDDAGHQVWYHEEDEEEYSEEGFENEIFINKVGNEEEEERVRGEEVRGEEVRGEEVRGEEVCDDNEE